jgi:hypothetical protein
VRRVHSTFVTLKRAWPAVAESAFVGIRAIVLNPANTNTAYAAGNGVLKIRRCRLSTATAMLISRLPPRYR